MIRILILFALSLAATAADLKSELAKAAPFAARDGCANSARKLRAGGPFTVVFFGGSITENRGFSAAVPEWLRGQFPAAKIDAINAGWAGTGSELGAQRLDAEVLARKPDLVFVEFAVNDIAKPEFTHMERIVRKLWTANAETDVVFLYTISKGALDFYRKGWFPLSVSRHELAAKHYAVPMIAIGQSVATNVLAGTLKWEDFSNDTCHPHANGYTHYTTAITAALPAPSPMKAEDGRDTVRVFELPQPGKHWTGAPEYGEVWRLHWQPIPRTATLDAAAGLSRAAWRKNVAWLEEPGFFTGESLRWLAGGRTDKAGCFGANGTEAGVITFIAPQSGDYLIEVSADGIGGYSQREKAIGLNVVQFPQNTPTGRSVLFVQTTRASMQPITLRATTTLAAGDEIALVFLPHQVGGGAFFTGLNARFGLLK